VLWNKWPRNSVGRVANINTTDSWNDNEESQQRASRPIKRKYSVQ